MDPSTSTIPRPLNQPPEVDYLQNRQNDYRSTNTAFDVDRQRFVPAIRQVSFDLLPPQEHKLQLAQTTESFKNAVEKLKKKRGKDKEIANFNLDDAHSWEDIDKIVKTAQETYLDTGSVSGKMRKFFRRIGQNGKSMKTFVGLLPDGNYKTLCGGLTLILSAMVAHTEIREKMTELLEELPNDIEECEDYSLVYPKSDLLRQRVEELYIDLLAALEDIIKWYTQGTARHVRDSLLKNQDYSQAIDVRIRNVKRSRVRIQSATRRYLHRRLQMTQETGLDTLELAQDAQGSLSRIEDAVDDAKRGAQQTEYALIKRMSSLETKVLNNVKSILGDQTKNAKWQTGVDAIREEYEQRLMRLSKDNDKTVAELRSRVREASYTPKSLADALGLGLFEGGYLDDVDSVYSKGLTETPQFHDRARWVAECREFSQWIDSDDSEIIVIHGNYSELEYLSPLSFLAALFYPKLVENRNVLVLPFFCGLHTGSQFSDSNEPSGPLLMVRALLTQILNIKTVDWDEGNGGLPLLSPKPEEVKKLDRGSISAYSRLVSNLVAVLREHFAAIFIIIDGIDYYDLTWEKEVKHLVKSFLKLTTTDEPRAGGVLKVMFAAATHSNTGWSESGKGMVVVDVPDEIDGEGESLEDLDFGD